MENQDNNKVTQDTIEGIDDFVPMPGADAVVTTDEENSSVKPTNNVFKRETEVNLDFLDDNKKQDSEDKEDSDESEKTDANEEVSDSTGAAEEVIKEIDEEFENAPVEENEIRDTSIKSDKSFVSAMKSLIDEETLLPFDEDKSIEEYTKKDWQELIKINIQEKERALREQTPKEFFDALPPELQYAAMHVAKGNTNLKDVFAALSRREEVKELDPSNDNHQEMIARQYLQATNFGSGDNSLIEDQVQEWVETGSIGKKAKQFKPKLDKMQEKILEADLRKQEETQAVKAQQKEAYMKNIYEALKPAELNGVKLTNKRQNMLWNELTTVKYQSMTGKPTNLLGKLLEEYQFSNKPRYDLIAEATWLLSDPEDYKAQLRASVETEITGETAKKLKTEEGRRLKSTVINTGEDEVASRSPKKKTVSRKKGSMFKRT
jgi:hypothetical protein